MRISAALAALAALAASSTISAEPLTAGNENYMLARRVDRRLIPAGAGGARGSMLRRELLNEPEAMHDSAMSTS